MTIFEDSNIQEPNKDYFSDLVGEDKKYKDQQALAFSRLKADEHIQKLETEMAELRKDLQARTTLAELTDKWAQMQTQNTERSVDDDNQLQRKDSDLTPEKIDSIFNTRLTEYEKTKARQANANLVKTELKRILGDNYSSKLKDELNRLGISDEYANRMAEEQPQAFLKLVSPSQNRDDRFAAPPKSTVIATFAPSNTERTNSYYEKIRTSDPNLYWSPKVQNQLHDDAIRLGEKFFDT